ncbi:MAG: S1C family serine protease [Verrucomicrobiales bacterium]
MKTYAASLLGLLIGLAALGTLVSAQSPIQPGPDTPLTIEINGKKIATDGVTGTITIRTDGEAIEIDTDGDGEAEEQIEKLGSTVKMGWLGIKTKEISPELAAQLELGGGAVIEMVLPDSPAEKAGLKDYDIITAVGEAAIETPEDLSTTIRGLAPGSAIGITVLRRSKPANLVATLGTRPKMPKPVAQDDPGINFPPVLGGDADEIRRRIEKIQKEMLQGMKLQLDLPNLGEGEDIVRMSSKSTSFSDDSGSITITTKDGNTHITAKDADGKLLYEGPAETEDDREKLPPEVLDRLERFEEMNIDIEMEGFEDKLLPPALEAPEIRPPAPDDAEAGD